MAIAFVPIYVLRPKILAPCSDRPCGVRSNAIFGYRDRCTDQDAFASVLVNDDDAADLSRSFAAGSPASVVAAADIKN